MEQSHRHILDYLNDRLSPDDRTAFEKQCQSDLELAEEVAELRLISAGLDVSDQVKGDHLDSELLARYAEQPSSLDTEQLQTVDDHLRSCADCREELAICREVIGTPETVRRAPARTTSAWRPALTIAAALALIVTAWLASPEFLSPGAAVETFEVLSGVQRSRGEQNHLQVDRDIETVRLEFLLPTVEGHTYTYTLVDAVDTPLMTSPDHPHQLPVAFEIPAAYLGDGSYTIWVIEDATQDGEPVDSIRVDFSVEIID